jgi:uncharacterized protein YndB with AHSA1/START domain
MTQAGPSGREGVVIDRATRTLRFERRVASSPSDVFAAWTQPEQITQWWDPAGEPLVACEIDLRVGGTFSLTSRSHPDRPFSGTYREIVPARRLVFDANGATGSVTLNDDGDATQMVVEIACPSEQHLDQFIRMGIHEGTSRTLDNLVTYALTPSGR